MGADYKARVAEELDWRDRASWEKHKLTMPDHDYLRILANNGLPWYVIRKLVELTLDTRTALANYKGAANDAAFDAAMTKFFEPFFDTKSDDGAKKETATVMHEVMVGKINGAHSECKDSAQIMNQAAEKARIGEVENVHVDATEI